MGSLHHGSFVLGKCPPGVVPVLSCHCKPLGCSRANPAWGRKAFFLWPGACLGQSPGPPRENPIAIGVFPTPPPPQGMWFLAISLLTLQDSNKDQDLGTCIQTEEFDFQEQCLVVLFPPLGLLCMCGGEQSAKLKAKGEEG